MSYVNKDGDFFDETFGVGTFYRKIGFHEMVRSLQIQGDGTAVASATVEHCDFADNLDGSTVDPNVAGVASAWQPDTAIGTLSIAASATVTGGARVSYGNQTARLSRVVLVVTTGGRIRCAGTGIR